MLGKLRMRGGRGVLLGVGIDKYGVLFLDL